MTITSKNDISSERGSKQVKQDSNHISASSLSNHYVKFGAFGPQLTKNKPGDFLGLRLVSYGDGVREMYMFLLNEIKPSGESQGKEECRDGYGARYVSSEKEKSGRFISNCKQKNVTKPER